MDEILLTMNSDGVLEQYVEPYATIEVESEEDYNYIQEAIKLYDKVQKGYAVVVERVK